MSVGPAGRAIAANAARLAGARFVGDGLAFLVFLAVARRFGPEGIGTYAHAFAVAGIVAVVANPALGDLGVRDLARRGGDAAARHFRALIRAQVLLAAVAGGGLAAALASGLIGAGEARPAIAASLYLTCLAVGRTVWAPAFAREAAALPALAETVCRAAAVAVALSWMLLPGAGLEAALAPFALAGLLYLGWAAWAAERSGFALLGPREPGGLGRLARAALVVGAAEIASLVFIRIEILLLPSLAGAAPTGVVAAGLKLVEVGLAPLLYLAFAALPRLSREVAGGTTRLAAGLLRGTTFLAGAMALGLLLALPPLVEPVFGPRFSGTAALAPWLAAQTMLFGFEVVLVRLTLAADRQRLYLALLAVLLPARAAACWLLVPWLGAAGAMLAAVGGLGLLSLGLAIGLRDRLPLTLQAGIAARLVAAFASAALAGHLAGTFHVVLGWAVAGTVYVGLSLALRLVEPTLLRAALVTRAA